MPKTPLMILGNEIHRLGSISSVESNILETAFINIEERLIKLAEANNHKSRSTAKWLGRWVTEINNELERRRHVFDTDND